MSQGDSGLRDPQPDEESLAGLCASCRMVRRLSNDRGSVFYLCRRSETDPRFPRYPRLPVLRCAGHERAEPPAT